MQYKFPEEKNFISQVGNGETALIELQNAHGMHVFLTNYGARIVGIYVPDKKGNLIDVNLGHPNMEDYTRVKGNYYGAVVARVCGRIRDSGFTIDGKEYRLEPNNGKNFLHGGENAFHTKAYKIENKTKDQMDFTYFSKDGEEGFPGNLHFKVRYKLTAENALEIHFEAKSDQKTPFNVTHHAYFNLNGEGNGDVLNQKLQIFTDRYLPAGADILPLGEIASVIDTPFDFTAAKPIGRDLEVKNQQLEYGNGYDHTFVLSAEFDKKLRHAATAIGDQSGIKMDVYTDQPGIHLYTGNFMEGDFPLKAKGRDDLRTGFCLETQHLADALNIPKFPSILLEPEESFKTRTIFKFSIEN